VRSFTIAKLLLVGVVAIGLSAGAASADILSSYGFQITGTSSAGSDTWTVDANDLIPSGDGYTWTLTSDVELRAPGGELIGTLESDNGTTGVTIVNDPVLGLNFNVTAGPLGGSFTISAPVLGFAPISPAEGRASAGITVTDLNGNGLSRLGDFAGLTKSYEAVTNGIVGGGGTLFADLVSNAGSAIPFDTVAMSEAFPAGGPPFFSPIAGAVSSMHAEFQFDLGPSDNAAGTSVFVVQLVPEPVTATMLVLGGVGVLVRRRRA
jgi:hypothetical protein